MPDIKLTEKQLSNISDGKIVEISLKEYEFDLEIQKSTNSQQIDVKPVQSVLNNSDLVVETEQTSNKKISGDKEELNDLLLEIKTKKNKLKKEKNDLEDDINSCNNKIRIAKDKYQDDLVEDIEEIKRDKIDKINRIDEKINDLKRKEYKIQDKIN